MTPLVKYKDVWLKREDQNITGSAKDRSLPLQIDHLIKNGFTEAVISSSGNAAISALHFCRQKNIPLKIFVSPKTPLGKLKLLENYEITPQPNSAAFKYARDLQAYNLRQSTDPVARKGYQQIGRELLEQYPQITSLFIPVGSGTTLLGIADILPGTVKIFAVQPASSCPIASHFDNNFTPESISSTDSLSVKLIPHKKEILEKCFGAIVVQESELKLELDTSPEGNLAYAAVQKAKNKYDLGSFPVILCTGTIRL